MRILLVVVFFISLALAHQTSMTQSGAELFWVNPNVPLKISTNTQDLSSSQVLNIINQSINQWNQQSNAQIISSSTSSNKIEFISDFPYGSAVLGLTEISFNSNGAIQKASIFLNDDYTFKGSPGLYPAGQVYLGDVVTHEMGHLFGLSHSEVLNSSMFYSSYSGQSTLSSDDKSGIRSKYSQNYGSITGFVKGGSGIGVLGVHLQAISRNTGESIGAISDENGSFVIGGLNLNDTYYIYTSAIKNPNSLPGYFANVQTEFCPGAYVGSFFSKCGSEFDGKPTPINLSNSAPQIDVGTITINCALRSDQNYNYQKLQANFTPIKIFDYDRENRHEKSFVGWFRKTTTSSWSTPDVFQVDLSSFNSGTNKKLKIDLVAFPFGSQREFQMSVYQNGNATPVTTKQLSPIQETQTYNIDLSATLPLSQNENENNFEIHIKSKRLGTSLVAMTFPAAFEFSTDAYLPYLVNISLMEMNNSILQPIMDSEAILSDNESCLDAPFTYAISKTEPQEAPFTIGDDQTVAAASCGTIDPPQGGSGSMLMMLTGFFMILILSNSIKVRKKFLS